MVSFRVGNFINKKIGGILFNIYYLLLYGIALKQ
jgi:hypothetical protein